jgi:hypothetical protein
MSLSEGLTVIQVRVRTVNASAKFDLQVRDPCGSCLRYRRWRMGDDWDGGTVRHIGVVWEWIEERESMWGIGIS